MHSRAQTERRASLYKNLCKAHLMIYNRTKHVHIGSIGSIEQASSKHNAVHAM